MYCSITVASSGSFFTITVSGKGGYFLVKKSLKYCPILNRLTFSFASFSTISSISIKFSISWVSVNLIFIPMIYLILKMEKKEVLW